MLANGRGVVTELIPWHHMVLHENLRKWPVLRDFCQEQGYGRLITDGRTGIKTFWKHHIPTTYGDAVLAALNSAPLNWPTTMNCEGSTHPPGMTLSPLSCSTN